ncbi:hypothetical protein GGS20DRAFT_162768 [Poronia punctata]|nr:hypothetical protein GGS20DRAFT_162768 [Poronia punctata]
MDRRTSLHIPLAQKLVTFSLFPLLPPELQIEVLSYALSEPRTVVVEPPKGKQDRLCTSLDKALAQTSEDDEQTWRSTTQIPTLLHVNHQARSEALRYYSLSFGVGEARPRIYVNFGRDTVLFSHQTLQPEYSSLWAKTRDLDKIRRVAVGPEGGFQFLWLSKVGLPSLEKFTFVDYTEAAGFGPLPRLVEDYHAQPGQDDQEDEFEGQMRLFQLLVNKRPTERPKQKRWREAKEEFTTLMTVLPKRWDKDPILATAVLSV